MALKPKYEYQIVCAQHGTRGHSTHAYPMPIDDKRRKQKVIDANHHSEMLGARQGVRSRSQAYYLAEAPWVIQKREVGKWVVDKGSDA